MGTSCKKITNSTNYKPLLLRTSILFFLYFLSAIKISWRQSVVLEGSGLTTAFKKISLWNNTSTSFWGPHSSWILGDIYLKIEFQLNDWVHSKVSSNIKLLPHQISWKFPSFLAPLTVLSMLGPLESSKIRKNQWDREFSAISNGLKLTKMETYPSNSICLKNSELRTNPPRYLGKNYRTFVVGKPMVFIGTGHKAGYFSGGTLGGEGWLAINVFPSSHLISSTNSSSTEENTKLRWFFKMNN